MRMPALLAGLLAICLGACASQAVGAPKSALALPDGVEVSLHDPGEISDGLVVLRYPSVVADEAQDVFVEAFINRAIGGSLDTGEINRADAGRIATSMVAKTNFFAMSLYDSLRKELPENAVILSPHEITLDPDGNLSSRPLMQSETLPSVLTVDFSPYSFPDSAQMMNAPPLTFGDLITPMLVVQTDHRAKPETYGLVMASAPLVEAAYHEAKAAALADLDATIAGVSGDGVTNQLAFVSFLRGAGNETPPATGLSIDANLGEVQVLKVEKLKLPQGAFTQMSISPERTFDPLRVRYSEYAAKRIVDALNDIDYDQAALAARIDALSRYDTEVAGLYLSGIDNNEVRSRLAFANRLLEAERKYISARSEALYKGTFEGERGFQMRQILVSEWLALDERRRLAREQNAATALAVLAVAASAYAAVEAGNSNTRAGQLTNAAGAQIAADAAALSGFRAAQAAAQSRAIGANTLIALAPVFEEQIAVQVDFVEGTNEITAASFEDFQERMLGLYTSQIDDIGLVAETCNFGDGGRWTGECVDGQANGKGRGIYTDTNGNIVEYFGSAENGVPHGVGYKLVVGGDMPQAWEGIFEHGVLNGEAVVRAPGSAPRGQVFEDGETIRTIRADTAPRLFGETEATS